MQDELRTMNDKVIRKAILEVVAFFDLFDYPLTQYEIWKYLKIKCDLESVVIALSALEKLSVKHGLYFLPGREAIIQTRMSHYHSSDRKIKRAMLVTRIFKLVPWIKMIAIVNIMGSDNLKEESDIDFLVVTDKQRVWITRFFTVGIVKFLNMRPQPSNQKDKICLSFFIDEDNLNLKKMLLPATEHHYPDIYFINWLAGLVPIFNQEQTYKRFCEQNNWLSQYLPNWQPLVISSRRLVKPFNNRFYRDIIDIFLGGLDFSLKKWQLKLLPRAIKEIKNLDSRVVIKNGIIKMHVNDRREYYRNQWLVLTGKLL